MFVKRADEMRRAEGEMVVADGRVRIQRMLTKADGIGFGFSDVHLAAGAELTHWYKHHRQSNHVLSGSGDVTDMMTGETWELGPSTSYNVGPEDRHHLRVHTDMHLLSIVCPPLVGDEQYDKDGGLAASAPA